MLSVKSPDLGVKHPYYKSDGSGRDTYVSYNSGGIWHSLRPREIDNRITLSTYMPAHVSKKNLGDMRPSFAHYHGDGTGRDSYVIEKYGGIVKNDPEYLNYSYNQRGRPFKMNNSKLMQKSTSSMFFNDLGEQAPIKATKFPRVYSSQRMESLSIPKSEAINGYNSLMDKFGQNGMRGCKSVKRLNY
jgi:hypothetical protein